MNLDDFRCCEEIVKKKVAELKIDLEKLKAVDDLIGGEATERKKHDILNTVMSLQDVQQEILNAMQVRLDKVASA